MRLHEDFLDGIEIQRKNASAALTDAVDLRSKEESDYEYKFVFFTYKKSYGDVTQLLEVSDRFNDVMQSFWEIENYSPLRYSIRDNYIVWEPFDDFDYQKAKQEENDAKEMLFYINGHFKDALRALKFINAINNAFLNIFEYFQVFNVKERTGGVPFRNLNVLDRIVNQNMARIWKEVTYNLQVCEFLAPMTENCLERIEKKLNYDFFYDEIYEKIANPIFNYVSVNENIPLMNKNVSAAIGEIEINFNKIANSSSLFHFCAEVGNPDDIQKLEPGDIPVAISEKMNKQRFLQRPYVGFYNYGACAMFMAICAFYTDEKTGRLSYYGVGFCDWISKLQNTIKNLFGEDFLKFFNKHAE